MSRLLRAVRGLFERYREQVLYLVFGAAAMVVSIATFWAAERVLGLPALAANIVSWVCAVAFAYLTNRTWVFESRAAGAHAVAREAAAFAAGRVVTLALEEAILFLGIELLGLDSMLVKVVGQVVVVVGNYLISKLVVFR